MTTDSAFPSARQALLLTVARQLNEAEIANDGDVMAAFRRVVPDATEDEVRTAVHDVLIELAYTFAALEGRQH